jgi:hypothetical protein
VTWLLLASTLVVCLGLMMGLALLASTIRNLRASQLLAAEVVSAAGPAAAGHRADLDR